MDEARIKRRPDFAAFEALMAGVIARLAAGFGRQGLPLAAE
jgi:hypothetical protein